ncbi:MAG: TolC family protein [Syntrophales bacterium]|jgi:outer membrane protein TolC
MKKLFFILWIVLLGPALAAAQGPIKKNELVDLQRAIRIALQYHPVIAAASGAVRANESKAGQARSNYYPQVNWQSNYSKIHPYTSTSARSNSSTYDLYASNLNLTQNIFDFGKTSSQVEIADLNTNASQQDLDNVKTQIVLGVKQTYYALLQALKNREVAQETVRQFQQHLDQAKGFFEVGVKPKFDVTKAEVDLSNAKLALIRTENTVRIARVNLNNAIGVPAAPEFNLENDLLFEKYEIGFEEALKQAYDHRPDLRSLMLKEAAASQSIELAKTGHYPYLTGSAAWGYNGTQFPLDDGWNVGAFLNFPIFSGFLVQNQIAEAKANLDVTKSNEEILKQQVRLEVEQAYSNMVEAAERIVTAQLTIRQAEDNLELANGRYATGVGNPIEVTDALVAVSAAKIAYISALTDYKSAQASLEKAMGMK